MKASPLPPIGKRRLRWFYRYVHFYLRRNFHGVHLLRLSPPDDLAGWPLLICVNHPSWWDPLLALFLSQRFFPSRSHYGPIAATGLSKYRFFERLGFFGIDQGSSSGARRFLHLGQTILERPDCALWVTPQGRFMDVRTRPVDLQPGVGHLAHRVGRFAMLPVAFEYAFWNERTPEAFACLGKPLLVADGRARSSGDWTAAFTSALEEAQTELSRRVARRDPSLFDPLLAGGAGVGGIYDLWRSLRYRVRGKKFEAGHGGI